MLRPGSKSATDAIRLHNKEISWSEHHEITQQRKIAQRAKAIHNARKQKRATRRQKAEALHAKKMEIFREAIAKPTHYNRPKRLLIFSVALWAAGSLGTFVVICLWARTLKSADYHGSSAALNAVAVVSLALRFFGLVVSHRRYARARDIDWSWSLIRHPYESGLSSAVLAHVAVTHIEAGTVIWLRSFSFRDQYSGYELDDSITVVVYGQVAAAVLGLFALLGAEAHKCFNGVTWTRGFDAFMPIFLLCIISVGAGLGCLIERHSSMALPLFSYIIGILLSLFLTMWMWIDGVPVSADLFRADLDAMYGPKTARAIAKLFCWMLPAETHCPEEPNRSDDSDDSSFETAV